MFEKLKQKIINFLHPLTEDEIFKQEYYQFTREIRGICYKHLETFSIYNMIEILEQTIDALEEDFGDDQEINKSIDSDIMYR